MWINSNKKALIVTENKCPYCGETLIMNKRSFANHVRWCKKNPRYDEIRNSTIGKLKKIEKEHYDRQFGEIKEFDVKCCKCGKIFQVNEREGKFPSKEKYFCSSTCAHSHKYTTSTKEKISNSIKKYLREQGKVVLDDLYSEDRKCEYCGEIFHSRKKSQKFCSKECACRSKTMNYYKEKFKGIETDIERGKILYSIYHKECCFKFPLEKYPEEFNFSLIKENGWYNPSNHGNNLNGIARDHMFSISNGFKSMIDPYYISHPANCNLLKQTDNSQKHTKCSVDKESLIKMVNDWNLKYGLYENKINYKLLREYGLNFN